MSGVIVEVAKAASDSNQESVQESFQESNQDKKDSHLRSILKAFSWRIVATLTTAVIAFFVTGDIATAITIGGIEFFLKMVIYYFHERMWLLY